MFITLKNASGQKQAELEQVSTRNAGPASAGRERGRGSRPACITCQQKKVRCTGHNQDCDRCRSRRLACIFPFQTKSRIHRRNDTPPEKTSEEFAGGMFDMNFDNIDMEMDMADFSPNSFNAAYASAMPATMSREANGSRPYQMDTMHQGMFGSDFNMPAMNLSPVSLPTMNPSPASLSSTTHDVPVTLPALDEGDLSSAPTEKSPSGSSVASTNSDSYSTCSCMHDAMRVVQQLDDDDFRITTLTLDQVLQLQKRFMSQCSSTLDCPNCISTSSVHTVLIIICDRLTEMFECIHRRMQKLSQRVSTRPTSSRSSKSSSIPLSGGTAVITEQSLAIVEEQSAQLFCSTYGGRAGSADCNPGLFLPEMQAMYSDQEQVHLIKVLIGLHIDNFQELLDRVYRTSQIGASQARCSKINSMMRRLSKAKYNVDSALQAVLLMFSPMVGVSS